MIDNNESPLSRIKRRLHNYKPTAEETRALKTATNQILGWAGFAAGSGIYFGFRFGRSRNWTFPQKLAAAGGGGLICMYAGGVVIAYIFYFFILFS